MSSSKTCSLREGKLPETFRPVFWDTDFDHLDLEKNRDFIISRLWTKGGYAGIFWVKERYSKEEIKDAAIKRRDLNPIVANYLSLTYDIDKKEMAYYQMERSGGRELWDY